MGQDRLNRKGCEPAKVNDADVVTLSGEAMRDAEAHPESVGVADHGDGWRFRVSLVVDAHLIEGHQGVRRWIGGQPQAIALLMKIFGVVERDGLEEHTNPSKLLGSRSHGAEHTGRVIAAARAANQEARDLTQRSDAIVIVEVTTESFLVGEARNAHDHRIGILPLAKELHGACFSTKLVNRIHEVGKVLNLGEGEQASMPSSNGHAEDALLVEQGVEHPTDTEALHQVCGDMIDAALASNILSEHDHPVFGGHQIGERTVELHGETLGPVLELWEAVLEDLKPPCFWRHHGCNRLLLKQGLHHLRPRCDLGAALRFVTHAAQRGSRLLVHGEDIIRGQPTLADEERSRGHEGVLGLGLLNFFLRPVEELDVGARVTQEPHRLQCGITTSA